MISAPDGTRFSPIISAAPQAGSRADDSAPFEMSLENALRFWVSLKVPPLRILSKLRIQFSPYQESQLRQQKRQQLSEEQARASGLVSEKQELEEILVAISQRVTGY